MGINYRIGESLFVANERSVRCICAINARFPAGLEEDFVTAEECQIHTGCSGRFNIGALPARPVLIMRDRHENLVLSDQRAVAVGIYATEITEIVAVRLKPTNHWSFRGEQPRVPIKYVERPVVADFVGAASRVSRVETVPTVVVVGVPGLVGRLHQDVGVAGIITHDKNRGARLPGVQTDESGKIDSGDGRAGHRPRGGYKPVAAIG